MASLVVFLIGALFAVGLAISGMTQPQKVIGFLDIAGDWDPSLMWVMIGAIATYTPLFRWVLRRKGPVFASLFRVPTRRDLTPSLAIGSVLFGIGWGLSGFCPGPAIASTSTASTDVLAFLGTMLAGMVLHRIYDRARTPVQAAPQGDTPPA